MFFCALLIVPFVCTARILNANAPYADFERGYTEEESVHPCHPRPAEGGEEERAGGLSVGCDNFLRKPFREADIFAIMNKYMGVL